MVNEQNEPNLSKNGTKDISPLPTDQSLWSREELEPKQSYFLLTNRYNLVDILSSGLIKPASQYTKYYRDLGETCPKAIPLLTCIPSAAFIGEVIDIDLTTFPVLIQVNLQGMHGSVQVIRNDFQVEQMELPVQGDALSVVVMGAIPVMRIQAVYFQSDVKRAEHMDREYENIRSKSVPMYVSPEHFHGSDMAHVLLLAALDHINTKFPIEYSETFRDAKALGGAFLMLGGFVTRDSRTALETLIPPLTSLQDSVSGMKKLKTAQRSSKVDGWLTLLPSLLLEVGKSSGEIDEVLEIPEIVAASEEDRIATLLFTATVKTLTHMSWEDYYPEHALKRIRRAFEAELLAAENAKENPSLLYYQDRFDAIQAVLRTEKSLAHFPYLGEPLVAALLFFLLRSEPERALSLIKEYQQLASDVLALAAVFSGILYRREMIPVNCRPTPTFEHFVDDVVAQRLNILHQGPVTNQALKSFSVKRNNKEKKEILGIPGSSSALIVRNIPIPVAQSVGDDKGLSNVVKQWLASELKSGVEKEIAFDLCRKAHWDDCVTNVMVLEGQTFYLSASDGQKLELRIPGFVTPVFESRILVDKFRRRVIDKWERLPDRLRQEVEDKLKRATRFPSEGKI